MTTSYKNVILNASQNKTARRLEAVTGIPKEVWIFGTPRERQSLMDRAIALGLPKSGEEQ